MFYKQVTPETALAQLESGELDAAFNVGATNADPLSAVDILNVQIVNSPGIFTLVPIVETHARPDSMEQGLQARACKPVTVDLSDKRVRQAMYYAIDRRAINDQLFGGSNRILVEPAGFKEYDDLNKYEFNVDKAKSLLAAAQTDGKFDPSKPIRFMYATDLADGGKVAPIVKQQLEAAASRSS